jgi:hypothetical protein
VNSKRSVFAFIAILLFTLRTPVLAHLHPTTERFVQRDPGTELSNHFAIHLANTRSQVPFLIETVTKRAGSPAMLLDVNLSLAGDAGPSSAATSAPATGPATGPTTPRGSGECFPDQRDATTVWTGTFVFYVCAQAVGEERELVVKHYYDQQGNLIATLPVCVTCIKTCDGLCSRNPGIHTVTVHDGAGHHDEVHCGQCTRWPLNSPTERA